MYLDIFMASFLVYSKGKEKTINLRSNKYDVNLGLLLSLYAVPLGHQSPQRAVN